MLAALARGINRRPIICLLAWLAVAACSVALASVGVTGEGLFGRVTSSAPRTVNAESSRADDLIARLDVTGESYMVIVTGAAPTDPQAIAPLIMPIRQAITEIEAIEDVANVVAPLEQNGSNPATSALIAADGQGFLILATTRPDLEIERQQAVATALQDRLTVLTEQLNKTPGVTALLGSESIMTQEIVDQMEADLATGELISLPVALLVMVLVFAGFQAAALPLLGALASIAAALGAMFGLSYLIDIHTSVINVITIVAVGLSIDYGLLIVSRFREELRNVAQNTSTVTGSPPTGQTQSTEAVDDMVGAALAATLTTAGRTVMFSALTIAASIAGLIAFEPPTLRTFGLGGLIVVLLALATALTLVPAGLRLLGQRMIRFSPLRRLPLLGRLIRHRGEQAPDHGLFSRLAGAVQRAPWLVIALVLAVLAVLALPVGQLEIRNSTSELLPAASSQRQFLEQLDSNYPLSATPAVTIVALTDPATVTPWAQSLKQFNLITAQAVVPHEEYTAVALQLSVADPASHQAADLVKQIRNLDADFEFLVTGPAARLTDFLSALSRGAPWAAGIVAFATLLLLFLMTGSALIPIKALLSNVFTLVASLGVVTWLFQQGHGADLLGFTPVSGLESYIVVLLFIFGFGLAMDYEVFLISRIKEAHDNGMDTNAAVRFGLQRSGRIITSAALIIILVFLGFAAGKLVVIKEIGLGLAITVFIDATLVRMLLVPATMTVLGRWNWAAPKPLRNLHRRLHLEHH
jgi:RND superfamily putative drug exporter